LDGIGFGAESEMDIDDHGAIGFDRKPSRNKRAKAGPCGFQLVQSGRHGIKPENAGAIAYGGAADPA